MRANAAASMVGICRERRRLALFQWFLTALSVRPSSSLAISAHRLPYCRAEVREIERDRRRGGGRAVAM